MLKNGVYFTPGYYEYNAYKVVGDDVLPIATLNDPGDSFWDYEKDKPVSRSCFNAMIDDLIEYFKTDYRREFEEKHENDDKKLYSPTKKEWAEIKRQMKLQLSRYID